jgi:PhnB protein
MSKSNSPVPRGWHTVTPAITVRNAAAAIDFYKRVFEAEELTRMTSPDGKVAHCELKIGDSMIMLNDEFPHGNAQSPETLGGTAGGLMLYVPDVDAVFDRAVKAGAQSRQPVADMFWGDRYGNLVDPFGQVWAIATHQEDLSALEIDRRAKEFYAKMKAA